MRDPKEAGSEARFSRRGNRQRKQRQTRQRLRSKTRLPELNLRVASPAWLTGRHSHESGDFVHESRAGTREPKESESRNEGLARGAEVARERRKRQRLRSKMRTPREDDRSTEGLAVGAGEDRNRKIALAAWPMMRDPEEIGSGTEGLAGRRKRTAATEDSSLSRVGWCLIR